MRKHSKILCLGAIASLAALTSCGSKGVFSSPLYLAVVISPRPASVPEGGSVVLTGTATNNLGVPQWSLLDTADTPNAGSLTAVVGSPNSILYTAPPAPPIYNASVPGNFSQGTVTVQATVDPPMLSTLPVAHDSITIVITAPTVAVSLSPATVSVPVGATQFFYAYEVGSINTGLTWQVNGVTGGSTTTGTILPSGLFTAPASVPMTGNPVTLTVFSQADPSKSASAIVTLF